MQASDKTIWDMEEKRYLVGKREATQPYYWHLLTNIPVHYFKVGSEKILLAKRETVQYFPCQSDYSTVLVEAISSLVQHFYKFSFLFIHYFAGDIKDHFKRLSQVIKCLAKVQWTAPSRGNTRKK